MGRLESRPQPGLAAPQWLSSRPCERFPVLTPLSSRQMHWHDRRLTHWDVTGHPMFITFRLHGTLPRQRVFPHQQVTSGAAFAAMDRLLDLKRDGPRYLIQPAIARPLVEAILDCERRFQRVRLHSWVVMPNHVHLLVTPSVIASQWLGPLKGYTASLANRILQRRGNPFWQDESYDHVVRNGDEFARIQRYIENNPVRAGLCEHPEDFRWSSAWAGWKAGRSQDWLPHSNRIGPMMGAASDYIKNRYSSLRMAPVVL